MSGGSGISFAVSHLLQVIRDAKAGKPHPRQFSIIWMVKSRRMSPLYLELKLTNSPLELDSSDPTGPRLRDPLDTQSRTPYPRYSTVHPPPIHLAGTHFHPPRRPRPSGRFMAGLSRETSGRASKTKITYDVDHVLGNMDRCIRYRWSIWSRHSKRFSGCTAWTDFQRIKGKYE